MNNAQSSVEQISRWIESGARLSVAAISESAQQFLKNALVPAERLTTVWASKGDELQEMVVEQNPVAGSYGYIDKETSQFVSIDQSEVEQYAVDVPNFIKSLQRSVGLTSSTIELVPNHLWYLGSVLLNEDRVAPLFLAREIDSDVVSMDVIRALMAGCYDEGVLISTAPRIQGGYTLAGQQLTRLNNVAKMTSKGVALDMKKLEALFACHSQGSNK
jgi:hypothetical protein